MTDIVFLLLIFFMLTSTLVSSNALQVDLPKSNSRVQNAQSLSVTITKDGTYFVNAIETPLGGLADKLRRLLKGKPNPSFRIQAEVGTPIEKVVRVLDMAQKNNYKAVLATQPKP